MASRSNESHVPPCEEGSRGRRPCRFGGVGSAPASRLGFARIQCCGRRGRYRPHARSGKEAAHHGSRDRGHRLGDQRGLVRRGIVVQWRRVLLLDVGARHLRPHPRVPWDVDDEGGRLGAERRRAAAGRAAGHAAKATGRDRASADDRSDEAGSCEPRVPARTTRAALFDVGLKARRSVGSMGS